MDGELHRVYDFHEVSAHKYPNLIRIESQLMVVSLAIFVSNELQINSIDQLYGLSVAYQAGRKNVSTLLRNQYPEKNILAVTTDDQAFNMLATGRVDVVISESFLGKIITSQKTKFKNVREIHTVKGISIYAYINIKHAALATRIAATLDDMKKDSSFQRITKATEQKLLQSAGSLTQETKQGTKANTH